MVWHSEAQCEKAGKAWLGLHRIGVVRFGTAGGARRGADGSGKVWQAWLVLVGFGLAQ